MENNHHAVDTLGRRGGEVAIPRQNDDKPTRSSTAYEKSDWKGRRDASESCGMVHVIADSTAVEEVKISNLRHDR
jgi:hypothetical protein